MTENIYCHENGLKHINLVDDGGFSALFVVNTPIFDNSGVAHGVEHMVFRRSTAFPQPETLFQLTSLTDAKINASTFANKTYFHCQSQCYHTFMLAVNYLLNGLFDPIFDTEDLRCEIHDGDNKGVIYQELIGKEQANNEKNQSTHKSDANQFSYGGISTSIGKLSLNDLIAFHQHYYRASNIILVTANANVEQIAHLIDLLPKQTELPTQVKIEIETQKKQSLNREPNNAKNHTSRRIQESENNDPHQKKYSSAINKLIRVYYFWLENPYCKKIKHIKKQLTTNKESLLVNTQRDLIPALINLSTKLAKNIDTNTLYLKISTEPPSLPNLFTTLCQQAKASLTSNISNNISHGYATDQRNALWLTNIKATDEVIANITSYIISASPYFLAPRCQGLCYATQALTIEKSSYFVIYSAFNVDPNYQLKALPHCLLRLSQDDSFISMSLALAKIKYRQAYQVNNSHVMNITVSDISVYLQTLINKNLK
ncbi:insulinase family protein [Colwellia sp. E150_009]